MKIVANTSYFLNLLTLEITNRISDVDAEESRALIAEGINSTDILINAATILVNAINILTNQSNITSNLGLITTNQGNITTNITGIATNVYDIANHNHNLVYSLLTHNHNSVYSLLTHNHSGVYLPLTGGVLSGSLTVSGASAKGIKFGAYSSITTRGGSSWIYMRNSTDTTYRGVACGALHITGSLDLNGNQIVDGGRLNLLSTSDIYAYKPYATTLSGRDLQLASSGQFGTLSSSIYYKYNVEPLISVMSIIEALRPVSFYFDSEKVKGDIESKKYGFIAEEIAEILPESLYYIERDGKIVIDGFDHKYIIPINTRAIQELSERIKILEQKLFLK